jgi:hypothetical protein
MAAMTKVVADVGALMLAAACGSGAKTDSDVQSVKSTTPTTPTPSGLTSSSSNAEILVALGIAGLTCTGTTQTGWGSVKGLPDVTPAEPTVCWIGDGQPAATASNTLISAPTRRLT